MSTPQSQVVVSGTIATVYEPKSVPGKNQTWLKQEFILEIPGGTKPRKLMVELWGEDNINKYDLEVGLQVKCYLDLESKEHNSRWYTHAQAWKITWEAQPRRSWQPGQNG